MLPRRLMAPVLLTVSACGSADLDARADPRPLVQLVADESERRVEVLVDGEPFTAYVYPESVEKPVLFPLRSAAGHLVTRGFPLQPTPGERVDHPHHIGLWFNHGDVNGLDFWNNSAAVRPENAPRMGTVLHRQIRKAESGRGVGVLEVSADWVDHVGSVLLREDTRFLFGAADGKRTIDRISTLSALDQPVRFGDSKEGLLGLRVARALEHPTSSPVRLTDSAGRPSQESVVDNHGVSGSYVSAEGREGDDVWGTRARWMALRGSIQGEPVTLAILDHPDNLGFPTHWHARGYGLFAANPLGPSEFDAEAERMDFTLGAGASVSFRYRILVLDEPFTAARIEAAFEEFSRVAD